MAARLGADRARIGSRGGQRVLDGVIELPAADVAEAAAELTSATGREIRYLPVSAERYAAATGAWDR
jgi:hypothetical protein